MKVLRYSAAILVVLALVGCSKPSAVGKWTGSKNEQGSSATVNLEIKNDKTFSIAIDANFMGQSHKIEGTGTWTADEASGDTQGIKMTGDKGTMDGKPQPNAKEATTATYNSKSDTLSLTSKVGATFDLTRVKEGK